MEVRREALLASRYASTHVLLIRPPLHTTIRCSGPRVASSLAYFGPRLHSQYRNMSAKSSTSSPLVHTNGISEHVTHAVAMNKNSSCKFYAKPTKTWPLLMTDMPELL
ncbi:hypothetical protein M433DRAFT_165835 [Acidomyces richmondensis BFW]|nr:MAG: hypothetical protein FE78DRAFT_107378 [Acidomyces sp. 'richmondensis']KYG45770.1 hypothetical protein M433DRAFT_165835 [Acidomyces richmondensis BFW]